MIELLQVAQVPPFLIDRLKAEYTVHDFVNPSDPEAMLREIGPNIRGIVAGGMKGPDAALINALDNLEIIASFSVGFDATDVAAAQTKGVIVTHTPEVLTGDVADLAMAFILMAPRRIGESERFLRVRHMDRAADGPWHDRARQAPWHSGAWPHWSGSSAPGRSVRAEHRLFRYEADG